MNAFTHYPAILEDYSHENLLYHSLTRMQLDVFLPFEKLALEYQGQQHYKDCYSLGPQWIYQQRDIEKKMICNKNGITLIEIPYWWDFAKESLQATIYQIRPDLLLPPSKEIFVEQLLVLSGN